MRVAFVIDKFPPFIGGAELQAERLAQLVAARVGHSRVFTSQSDARSDTPAVTVRRLGTSLAHPLRHAANFAAALGHFLVQGGGCSVVHGYALSGLTCGAVLGARWRGCAALIKVCSVGPDGDIAKLRRQAFGRWLWPLIRRECSFVVPSPAVIPELAAHGVSADAVAVIPNALSPGVPDVPAAASKSAARAALGLPDRPTVLFMGRLSPEKGTDLLMRAWERIVLECEATLVIAGAGSESARLERWAHTTTHPDRVRLVGARLDVDEFYRAADVLVVPSRAETFSNVMAEAMARALPVVTTPVDLATHWIRDGQSGLLVGGGDERHMARAVVDLIRDPARREALGRAAREDALASFSAECVVERHIELYRRLIAVASLPAAA